MAPWLRWASQEHEISMSWRSWVRNLVWLNLGCVVPCNLTWTKHILCIESCIDRVVVGFITLLSLWCILQIHIWITEYYIKQCDTQLESMLQLLLVPAIHELHQFFNRTCQDNRFHFKTYSQWVGWFTWQNCPIESTCCSSKHEFCNSTMSWQDNIPRHDILTRRCCWVDEITVHIIIIVGAWSCIFLLVEAHCL